MEKKTLTPKEIFCGMPFLQGYFRYLDSQIRRLAEEEKLRVQKKRSKLLRAAKQMDSTDLKIKRQFIASKELPRTSCFYALKKFLRRRKNCKIFYGKKNKKARR